jgi:hypothetical protein
MSEVPCGIRGRNVQTNLQWAVADGAPYYMGCTGVHRIWRNRDPSRSPVLPITFMRCLAIDALESVILATVVPSCRTLSFSWAPSLSLSLENRQSDLCIRHAHHSIRHRLAGEACEFSDVGPCAPTPGALGELHRRDTAANGAGEYGFSSIAPRIEIENSENFERTP